MWNWNYNLLFSANCVTNCDDSKSSSSSVYECDFDDCEAQFKDKLELESHKKVDHGLESSEDDNN